MKKSLFLISFVTLLSLFPAISNAAPYDFAQADELFDKGSFQQALGQYEEIYKAAKSPEE